jgi:hypothetical protein
MKTKRRASPSNIYLVAAFTPGSHRRRGTLRALPPAAAAVLGLLPPHCKAEPHHRRRLLLPPQPHALLQEPQLPHHLLLRPLYPVLLILRLRTNCQRLYPRLHQRQEERDEFHSDPDGVDRSGHGVGDVAEVGSESEEQCPHEDSDGHKSEGEAGRAKEQEGRD